MIPTSIDGTDITGATIDGTDVQEITVDGDVVFSAETLPVAYSDLVAWYPFDSSEYGGSHADDATALFNPGQSGDSTAYDGTVSGATYQSSGGVTDINAGANSGGFEFNGSNDFIDLNSNLNQVIAGDFSVCCWVEPDNVSSDQIFIAPGNNFFQLGMNEFGTGYEFAIFDGSNTTVSVGSSAQVNEFAHVCGTYDASSNTMKLFVDGVEIGSDTSGGPSTTDLDLFLGYLDSNNDRHFDGVMDDVRFYDTVLTTTEVENIVQNTQDPNNPVFP